MDEITELILAPFFGSNIVGVIYTDRPKTVVGMVQSACKGRYPLTWSREIGVVSVGNEGTIKVYCRETANMLWIIKVRK